jgi:hypothetical protein
MLYEANILQLPKFGPHTPLRTIWRLLIKHKKGLYHSNYSQGKKIIRAYEKHRFNYKKPRQAGVSTTTAAYMSIKVGWADVKTQKLF